MEKRNLINKYLLMKPSLKSIIEWSIIIFAGIFSMLTNILRMPLYPVINISGLAVFLAASLFHWYCEKTHKRAHDQSERIKKVIMTGIYSKIRHPLYLSLIFMDIGLALIFNSFLALIFSIIFSIFSIITALEEEKFLIDKFKIDYQKYLKKVKWRMIPGIF